MHLQFNESWQGSEQDYGYSIVLDSNNNTFITGYTESYGGSDRDACIIKFNSSGEFQWYKLWTQGLEDEGYGIAIDQADNKVITGIETNFLNIFFLYTPLVIIFLYVYHSFHSFPLISCYN